MKYTKRDKDGAVVPSVVYDRIDGPLDRAPVDCRELVASDPERYSHSPWPEEAESDDDASSGAEAPAKRRPGRPRNNPITEPVKE